MTTIYKLDDEAVTIHVQFHPNTIELTGYQDVTDLAEDGEDGEYMTHHEIYSGYTLSECLCKALMDMDRADDWTEAIAMIEEAGIPYETDEEE